MMIDRAGLAKTVYDGTAVPQYAILSAGFQAADPAAYATVNADSVTKPDLAEAKALVKAANPPKGPAEIVVTQGDTGSIDAATVIQAAGRQLGLNMPIRQLTGEQFGTALFSPAARKSFAVMVGNGYLYTPLEYLMTGIVPGASTNLDEFNDPKTTALLTAAEATNNVAKQSQLLAAAEARANNWSVPNAGGSIPIEDFAERLYMNHRVTGAPACFCYLTYPWAALLGGS